MHALQEFEQSTIKKDVPEFKAGDTVKVHCRIKEGSKERVQIFQGVVLSRHRAGASSTFMVRKVSYGIGVERVFPLHAPFVEKIEVLTQGKVRQSRIYYLRNLSGKKARITALDTRQNKKTKPGSKDKSAKVEVAKESAPEPKVAETKTPSDKTAS